ncbi:MAG: polymer-forming cytoskeletal protein [Rhodothermales bacterium]|nr:polymer-forming cytoskeletal protein [Rhodothermales bacterium]
MVSLLGTSARFVGGNLKLCHDVRIDGDVESDLEVDGRAIISKTGKVSGRIVATNLIVAGEIHGNIEVHETLVLKESARVYGSIEAQDIVTEKGARGEMTIKIGNKTPLNAEPVDSFEEVGMQTFGRERSSEAELFVMGDIGNPMAKMKPVWKSGVRIVETNAAEKVLPDDSDDAVRGRFW